MNTPQDKIDPASLANELTRLIAFRPVTSDRSATRSLLEYVDAELAAIGLKSEVREHNGYTYLVAGTKSLEHSHVLLQAHIDVVPAAAELFVLDKTGDKLTGRGTYDMLFGTAAFLATLRELKRQGKLGILDLGVMLSSDEEIGGFNTAKPVMANYGCDICFLPDAGAKDTLSVSAKGVLQLELTFVGKSGHASRPHEYDNPIYKLADCIADLRVMFLNNHPDRTVCSMTVVEAGTALNQTPENARLSLDIRYVPEDNPKTIERKIAKLAAKHDGELHEIVCEPAFVTDKDNPLVNEYVAVHEALTGRTIRHMVAPSSSDARFLSAKRIPVIMLRPEGGSIHGSDEWVSLSSLTEFTKILCTYLQRTALPDMYR